MWWNKWNRQEEKRAEHPEAEQEKMWETYLDVRHSQLEWERAHLLFQEAAGQDQIDYAIYMLEAAERKYQINLKQAKELNMNGAAMYREEIRRYKSDY